MIDPASRKHRRWRSLWPVAAIVLVMSLTWTTVRAQQTREAPMAKLSKALKETKDLKGPVNERDILSGLGQGPGPQTPVNANMACVIKVLDAEKIQYERPAENQVVFTWAVEGGPQIPIVVVAEKGLVWIIFRNVFSLPSPSREQLEALMKRNFDLCIGSYGWDKESGEVNFDHIILGGLDADVFRASLAELMTVLQEDVR